MPALQEATAMDSDTALRSIFIVGPSSTGKTTLCTALVYALLAAHGATEAEARRRALTGNDASQRAVGRYRRALVIFLKPARGWLVDDGMRSIDDHGRCVETFRDVLAPLETPYEEIGEECMGLKERVAEAEAYLAVGARP
jgi:nicotinamide riboside kinase